MKRIGIIGGGIVGLSAAYYLRKAGCTVTVYDQGNLKDGCSFGNAGMIVPSHFTPLAAPGMVAKGIRWMFNAQSPFYIKPRLSRELIDWGWQFYKHANRRHVERSMPALAALSLYSRSMYQQWATSLPFNFGFQERGLLMLYHTAELEKEEIETAHVAKGLGIEAHPLTLEEIQKMEPDVRVNARGGVYYPGDAHLTPRNLVERLIEHLNEQGVVFETSTTIKDFVTEKNAIKAIRTNRGEVEQDEWVLAAGSWSGGLSAQLGIRLPMQAGKGYSFTLEHVKLNTRIPTIFLEARVAVTPMGDSLRFGGTMEVTGIDNSINMNRVRGIVDSIPRYYPEMSVKLPNKEDIWHGLRPCSPDGLPFIGRTRKVRNLIVATGHAMMGVSLGPGTGKLVSELVLNEEPGVDLSAFDPERFDGSR